MKIYALYDKESVSVPPIIAAYYTQEKAEIEKNKLAEIWVEDCFAVDPKDSGLIREYDENMIRKACLDSIGIQVINLE